MAFSQQTRQSNPIDGSWHPHIGKDQVNRGILFKDRERPVRRTGFDNPESRVAQRLGNHKPDKYLILHDENGVLLSCVHSAQR